MKALVKKQFGYDNMEYIDVPDILPHNDEVKIKVIYTGICGTDIHAFKGEYNKVTPLVLGHEFVGEIIEIGSDVTLLEKGMIVSSETTFETCNICEYCLNKEYNLCSDRKGLGTQINGSFSEFIIAKANRCHIIPESIDYKNAAMLEPLACCVHAVYEKAHIISKEKIAVFGPGPIGLIMSLVLKTFDVEVILIGVNSDKDKLSLAKKLGIDYIINSQEKNLSQEINKLTNNKGVDKIFECSGNIHALHQSFEIIKKKGTIIQEGLFKEDINPINLSQLIHKEIIFIGSRTQKPSSWSKSIELLTSKKINLTPLISNIYPLNDWRSAFNSIMVGNEIKVLLTP